MKFLLCVLATYRMSHMVAFESGLFGIPEKLRVWAEEKFALDDTHWRITFFSCFNCQSFWWSLIFSFVMYFGIPVKMFIMYWLAISGFTVMAHVWLYGRE